MQASGTNQAPGMAVFLISKSNQTHAENCKRKQLANSASQSSKAGATLKPRTFPGLSHNKQTDQLAVADSIHRSSETTDDIAAISDAYSPDRMSFHHLGRV
jgi:hypothetical protein